MFFLLFTFFLIASAFLANKFITLFLSPDVFVVLRMGISGLLLLLLNCREKSIWKAARENFSLLFIIAIFTTTFPSLLRAYALKMIPASRASFWGALEPFISIFYMRLLYGTEINRNQIIGIILGCLASLYFVFSQTNKNIFLMSLFCLADLAQIGSLVISRFGWIKGQELMKKEIFKPQQLNAFCFLISASISLCFVFLRGGSFENLPYLFSLKKFSFSFLYTVIVGNMIAYTLYAYVLKHTTIASVSVVGLSIPLFVHFLSFFFLSEPLSIYFFISVFFLAIALFIFQKK